MKKLIYENTLYSLLLYILYDNNWKNNSYLLYGDRLSEKFLSKLKKKVRKVDFLESSLIDLKKKPILFYITRLKEILKYRRYNYVVGNVNCYFNPFKQIERLVIEDGLGSFYELQHQDKGHSAISTRAILELKQPFFYKGPEGYLLTGSFEIPKSLRAKCHILNISTAWAALSEFERNDILDLFSFNEQILTKAKSRRFLLLTQCFSEDGMLAEEDKVNGYLKLIESLKINQEELVIKTHPREKTDYKQWFKDSIVVDENVPFELLSLLGVKYHTVITLTSSSVFSLNYKLNIFYMGTSDLFNWKVNVQKVEPKIVKVCE